MPQGKFRGFGLWGAAVCLREPNVFFCWVFEEAASALLGETRFAGPVAQTLPESTSVSRAQEASFCF